MYKQLIMQTTIQKWGNSLALRIPGLLGKETGLMAGTIVEIVLENETLIIKPLKKKLVLSDLMQKVNDSNLHYEINSGEPTGRELW
jgi:antitoxin MazE